MITDTAAQVILVDKQENILGVENMLGLSETLKIIETIKEHLDNVNVEDAKVEVRVLETYIKGQFIGYQQGLKTVREE
tara:strand:- start:12958 stop:13191 length:234 start_codon:yes stop_codon:yes gene_type:complete